MNISLSAANFAGTELLNFIIKTQTPVQFVTTTPNDTYSSKIITLCKENGIPCYPELDINGDKFRDLVRRHEIDFHFMLWFPTIVKKESIESVNNGFINIHPSLLPYNRGMHPWYWAIVDKTPAGVTIHFIDEKIDNGNIIAQKEIIYDITDTGETIYEKLLQESISLFIDTFESIIKNKFSIIETTHEGTFHLAKDIESSSNINLDKTYKAEELINILRARTFTNGDGAYFYKDNKNYNIKLNIREILSNE